jgi:hypothetical protein
MKGSPAVVLSHQEVDPKRQGEVILNFGEGGHLCSVSNLTVV